MLTHCLTLSLREFRRAPIPAVLNVLTLSLGLVCFIWIYFFVHYWLLSEDSFENADRTYVITTTMENRDSAVLLGTFPTTTIHHARYLKAEYPELETVARSAYAADTSASTGERGLRLTRLIVDPEFLEIFDLPFRVGDPRNALTGPYSVVLTHDTATRLFGNEDPLGKRLIIANQVETTVTGVIDSLPDPSHLAQIELLASWDVWEAIQQARNPSVPFDPPEDWFGAYCCTTYVLLPDGGSLTEWEFVEDLKGFAGRRVTAEELAVTNLEVGATPLVGHGMVAVDSALARTTRMTVSFTTLLLALGGVVVLIACANYANLAAARSVGRAREVGIRKAVGANPFQIAVQYWLDAGLLVAAAIVIAAFSVSIVGPAFESEFGLVVNLTALGAGNVVALLLSLLVTVTLIAGAYPAWILSRVPAVNALRVGQLRSGPRFVSTVLVGTQFAVASFLLIAVFVMYSQNSELRRVGLGGSVDSIIVIDSPSTLTGIETETLRAELLKIPEVAAVTASIPAPWGQGLNLGTITRSPDTSAAREMAFLNLIDLDFFDVLEIPLLAGRVFDRDRDIAVRYRQGQGSPGPVNVVVERGLAESLGFVSPAAAVDQMVYLLGNALFRSTDGDNLQPIRIIGVVENRPLHLTGAGARWNFFLLFDDPEFQIVRVSERAVADAIESIDRVWNALSPGMAISRQFLDDVFNETNRASRLVNAIFVLLAVMALFIAIMGLIGMSIHVAGLRRHEMAVRKVLGATTTKLFRSLLMNFAKPVLVASLVAWPISYLAAQAYLSIFMHRMELTPLPFTLSLAFTMGIALFAVTGQALMAARVKPARQLRNE